jgi:hypothetical protein
MRFHILLTFWAIHAWAQLPKPIQGGYDLPNGWKITPAGRAIVTEDMVLKVVASPDGRSIIALHSGFNPHGLVVIDAKTQEAVQRIGLKSAWLGMAWSPDGKTLYVSGGNANGKSAPGRRAFLRDNRLLRQNVKLRRRRNTFAARSFFTTSAAIGFQMC